MPRRLAFAVVASVALVPVLLFAQSRSNTPSIQGVWRAQEISYVGGKNPQTIKTPLPYIRIYTSKHFSLSGLNTPSGQPRKSPSPAKDPAHLTDAEKIARFDYWLPFQAQTGTYEIKGNKIFHTWLVGKNEAPGKQDHDFKLDGNTLVLINNDSGPDGSKLQVRYTRLE